MSSRKEIKELEELLEKNKRVTLEAVKGGVWNVARGLIDTCEKLDQKIEGHRANLKRKK